MKQLAIKLRVIILASSVVGTLNAVIPFNLFEPYDVLIKPQRPANRVVDMFVAYEGSFKTRAFMGDDDLGMTSSCDTKGNVLQLWQKRQDAIAAFKGAPFESAIGQQAQLLNINDDNTTHGIYTPCGTLKVPANLMFGLQVRLPHQITLAAYVPYRIVELTDVVWRQHNEGLLFENLITPDLIKTIEKVGGMNLRGWKRHGFGDLMLQAEYYFHRPQAKPYLKNVGLELRGGLSLPTGLAQDPDRLLAFSFGNDGGVGILAAARLELWFIHNIRFGIDVQLLNLFGNTQCRRIKSDPAQTDLLLLTKISTFKNPGLMQHFTLYLDKVYFWRGFSMQLAYQYSKRSDDQLFICNELYNINVVNDAEYLQEWTAHNLIFNLKYEWDIMGQQRCKPMLSLFVKYGFNGKRAILADTAGINLSLAF